MANVVLNKIEEYNLATIEQSLKRSMESLRFTIKPRSRVMIKACLPSNTSPDEAKTSNPVVVQALVNVLLEHGCRCVIVDSPFKKFSKENLQQVYLNTGMLEVENLTKCELSYNLKTCVVPCPNGIRAKSHILLDEINNVDYIINLSKIRIHKTLGYLGATSNLFGFVPGEIKTRILNSVSTIADFDNYLLDLYNTIKDKLVLNIADAIVALEEGETPRMLSCLAVSENIFSLDAAMLSILGITSENSIINIARENNLIDINRPFRILGEDIVKFKLDNFKIKECPLSTIINPLKKQKSFIFANQKRVAVTSTCKGCSICSKICPTQAIEMKLDKNNELYAQIDYSKCIFCLKCYTACPYREIKIVEPAGYKRLQAEIEKQNN